MASNEHASLLALLEQTQHLLFVQTDANGIIEFANPLFENQFDLKKQSLVGQPISLFLSEEDRDNYFLAYTACMESMAPQVINFRLKEGQNKPQPILSELICVQGNDGKQLLLIGYLPLYERVNEQHYAQIPTRYPTRIKAIFEHANTPMLVIDEHMKCQEVNPAFCDLLAYSQRELLSMFAMQFLHESVPYEALFQDFLIQGKQAGRIKLVTSGGNIITVVYSAIANIIDDLHLVMVTDITDQVAQAQKVLKQNQQLRKLNQEKNKLFSIIAHDLKGPLSNLSSLLKLLSKGHITQEEFQGMLQGLSDNVTHSANLLQNLLFWSRSQLKGVKCVKHHFSFCELLLEKQEFFRTEMEKKNLTCTAYSKGTIWLHADRNMVELILINLLSNAIKFSHQGGEIMVSAKYIGKWVEICIADNGVGIPSKSIHKIFTQTYSTKGTANEKGTGLGLSVCQEFVVQNGGKIWVESQLGIGTKFYFTLRKGKKGDEIR